jgi:penicillin amidase
VPGRRLRLPDYGLSGPGSWPCLENEKAVARFLRQGFVAGPVVVLPEVDLPGVYLPEKRAQLAFLPREVAFPG